MQFCKNYVQWEAITFALVELNMGPSKIKWHLKEVENVLWFNITFFSLMRDFILLLRH